MYTAVKIKTTQVRKEELLETVSPCFLCFVSMALTYPLKSPPPPPTPMGDILFLGLRKEKKDLIEPKIQSLSNETSFI